MVKRLPQHKRARSVDLYLHAIMLLTNHGQQADTGDVATRVGGSPAAASRMLKNLAKKKLVRLEPYQGAELTPEGLHQALRHHVRADRGGDPAARGAHLPHFDSQR